MKAYLEAYGCALNVGESRELEAAMRSSGWEIVESPDLADMVVLSTCVVVAKTERNMLKRIAELSSARRLVITGCMAVAYSEKARAMAPGAELVAPEDLETFRDGLGISLNSRSLPAKDACVIIPIATGCRGSCSYCITRTARGTLRSRPPGRVIDAVSSAVQAGPREVQLAAQDTACYGSDVGTDLPSMVSELCRLPGDFRLRIGMMNPRSALPISDRIADMYLEKKVFKFLHLPVQSGSDIVLSQMARGYTVQEFLELVEKVRSRAPELSLSTDIIIGYPGETDEDHEGNLDVIARARPDIVNVTKFSPRPGTPASTLKGRIDGNVVKERSRQVTKVRFEVALRVNRSWIGREVMALATEHIKDGTTVLRTDEYRQIVIGERIEVGKYHRVTVDDATPTYLIGHRS